MQILTCHILTFVVEPKITYVFLYVICMRV